MIRRLRLVVPRAGASPSTEALLGLADALVADAGIRPDALLWLSGSRAPDFAARMPTIDAGVLDHWRPAVALRRVGLRRPAQALKTPRLRRLLADLPPTDVVWLGGLGAVPFLLWQDAHQPLVLQVDDDDLTGPWADHERTAAVLATAPVVVATGEDAATWAQDRGVDDARLARHALLDVDATEPDGPTAPSGAEPAGTRLVGLVNFGADEVADAVNDLALAARGGRLAFRWYGSDQPDWSLWQGRGGPPTHHVEVASTDELRRDLPHRLRALVHPVRAPVGDELRRRSAIHGVDLVALTDPVEVGDHLRAALDRPRPSASPWHLRPDEAVADVVRRLDAAPG